ncbi:unnamed protein product, partial [Gadus morhua 'NCC']
MNPLLSAARRFAEDGGVSSLSTKTNDNTNTNTNTKTKTKTKTRTNTITSTNSSSTTSNRRPITSSRSIISNRGPGPLWIGAKPWHGTNTSPGLSDVWRATRVAPHVAPPPRAFIGFVSCRRSGEQAVWLMMVTMATPLLLALLVGALPSRAFGEGACLQDGKHKTTPSAEPQLTECSLYTDNACCTVEDVQDIAHVPALSNKNAPWDHCGHLSSTCEVFLKRVSCFYRCSPDAARWPHPRRRSYIQAVPLCHSFCRDWFDACRMDLTCARNWARDPRGHNCTGTCVQYQQ